MINFEDKYYEQPELWAKDLLNIEAEHERISSIIEIIPPDVRTILDVGCGNGAFLNSLSDSYQAIGLDSSQEALKYVQTKTVKGDIAALPFESASFDLVTCLEVLEHLSCDAFDKALFELQRVSRKYIIISVPNAEDLDYHLVICPVCRCWYNPHRHVRSFNSKKLEMLFEHFELSELKEIGPLEPQNKYNRFLYAAYRLWRGVLPPSTAVCPQCGYQLIGRELSVSTVKSGGLLHYVLKVLKPFGKIIWRPQYRHRWLLAMYIKEDLKEQW